MAHLFKEIKLFFRKKRQFDKKIECLYTEFKNFIHHPSYTNRGFEVNCEQKFSCLEDNITNTNFDTHY